jgi:magnesium-transporting ATPase (P-type)
MATAVTLALALAFELPESDVMQHPLRDPADPILSPFLVYQQWLWIVLVAVTVFVLVEIEKFILRFFAKWRR